MFSFSTLGSEWPPHGFRAKNWPLAYPTPNDEGLWSEIHYQVAKRVKSLKRADAISGGMSERDARSINVITSEEMQKYAGDALQWVLELEKKDE